LISGWKKLHFQNCKKTAIFRGKNVFLCEAKRFLHDPLTPHTHTAMQRLFHVIELAWAHVSKHASTW